MRSGQEQECGLQSWPYCIVWLQHQKVNSEKPGGVRKSRYVGCDAGTTALSCGSMASLKWRCTVCGLHCSYCCAVHCGIACFPALSMDLLSCICTNHGSAMPQPYTSETLHNISRGSLSAALQCCSHYTGRTTGKDGLCCRLHCSVRRR